MAGRTRLFSLVLFGMIVLGAVAIPSFPPAADARREGGDEIRERFSGTIEARPGEGLHGTWVIGGVTVVTSPDTEFDETEGALAVGGCAKVEVRNGRVHEIDSDPPGACR
jgi:hypothetical protein